MNRTIKIISVLLMAVMLVMSISNITYAASDILTNLSDATNLTNVDTDGTLKDKAGRLLSVIQYIGILGGALVLAVLGIKYMLGSVEEKAEYKKSFIPLIVGAVVVMGAVSIAKFLFNIFG